MVVKRGSPLNPPWKYIGQIVPTGNSNHTLQILRTDQMKHLKSVFACSMTTMSGCNPDDL